MSDLQAELDSLPKYIYDEDNTRLWLTITTDVFGKWNIGYSTVDGMTPEQYAIGENKSLLEAVNKLKVVLSD